MRRKQPRVRLAVSLGVAAAIGVLLAMPGRSLSSPAPGQEYVKYYVVASSYQGQPENLTEIADRFLGVPGRSQEIFNLNAGRVQPDGGQLTDPASLHAGWNLVMPWDAYGTGVQYGVPPAPPPAAVDPKPANPKPAGPKPGGPQTPGRPTPSTAPVSPSKPPPPAGSCAAVGGAPGGQSQWGALRMAPEHAWTRSRGAGVQVAVVDSGVDGSLPGLAGRIAVGTDVVSGTGRGNTDCLGTGTAMASIIAARNESGGAVTGLAPDARILPVRLVTGEPRARPADQAAAIEFATSAGARVIALGGYVTPADPAVAAAIRAAATHDIVVVTGAQTDATAPAPSTSAAAPHVLRVGAVGLDGNPAAQYPPGSVDVVAPGVSVAALGISGAGQVEVSGGQYAVAFVAGEVALVRARYPRLTAAQVIHRVVATAGPVGSAGPVGGAGPGRQLGSGLIDPGLSVTRILAEEDPVRALRPAPGHGQPHPLRTVALVTITLLALATVVLLVLRLRRIIRPDPAATGSPAGAFGGWPAVQRREFVRAFVQHAWARPGTDRPVARPHVAVMVTIGVVVVAVVTGVVLQLLRPVKLSPAADAAPVPPSGPPRYTAVSGWDCATGADRGFEATGRRADWYTVARGGWAEDGCHGTFQAIPLSGDAHKHDQSQSAVWWFSPGDAMRRCDVLVYLPASDRPADSAATAAQFFVLPGRSGSAFASFVVDQTAPRGAWKAVGTFPVSRGGIAVQLINQGVPAAPTARLAVTQVKVACTG